MKGYRLLDGKIGYKLFRKTACTSILTELYRLQFGGEYAGKGNIHSYINGKSEYFTNIDDCEFKFVVVRDPVQRFLSAYVNRVEDKKNLSAGFLRGLQNGPELIAKLPVLDPGLDQFITGLAQYQEVPIIRGHTRPINEEMRARNFRYFDKVYRIEDLAELEKDLSRLLSTEVSFGQHQVSRRRYTLGELSYAQLEVLLEYYREDYRLLRNLYSPDDVRAEWLELFA